MFQNDFIYPLHAHIIEFRYKYENMRKYEQQILFNVKEGHVCNPPHTLGGALYHRFASRKLLSFRENQKAA